MKVVVNQKYSSLKSFVENLPNIFSNEGELIYKERNILKCYSVDGYNIVVKQYKKPHIINRIAYTFFRPSKAKRSYEYALKLLELGIETPAPIAYIEEFKCGLLTHGYLFSIYEKDFSIIRDLMDGIQIDDDLLNALALYIANLHQNGVLHLDISPGNMLYKKDAKNVHFTAIDINRMQFPKVISTEMRYKNFNRLSDNPEVLTKIAKFYAAATNLDEQETIEKIKKYSAKFFSTRK
ncbi:MAG: lipopolysaccharide kinase InaA family protein [Paludibacter sp.]